MSIIDDIKEANAKRANDKNNVAVEHMAQLERERVVSESYKKPLLEAFKARRAQQVLAARNKQQK